MAENRPARLPWPARIYLGSVALAAGGLLAWWRQTWRGPSPFHAGLLALLLALAVAAQHYPLMLGRERHVGLALALYFAAILLFSPPVAVALVGASQLLGGLTLMLRRNRHTGQRLRRLPGVVFNTAQLMLAAGLGSAAYYAALPDLTPAPIERPENLWALPAAAATLYVANSGAVAVMIGLQRRRNPLAVWRTDRWLTTFESAGLLLLGLALALIAARYPWGPLVLALPTALLYLSLRRTAHLMEAQQAIEAELTHRAFHDPLTELPNRALFHDRIVAALFLDLDRFKFVNDSLGHVVGDQLLVAVGRRLREGLRPGETAARFGGDEFTILLDDAPRECDAVAAAERFVAGLRQPLSIDGRELIVTASVGIALSAAGASPDDLLRQADSALYRAKADGGGCVLFDPGMTAEAARRLSLEHDLRQAIEAGELTVHYQPQVALATGRIVGLEALARWRHPTRGPVSPGEFIPLAEETGLIVPLDEWVLVEACRQAARWRQRLGDRPLLLSVNLSVRQLRRPDLVPTVARILRETGLLPACLGLELTESLIMEEAEATIATLCDLKRLGVHLAIDDFGAGYSNLRYLQRFPVDALKIDRSFVAGMEADQRVRGIVGAVITLAQTLDLQVVAEGVETDAQLTLLRALGCDLAQGYRFAPALPVEEVEALLLHERCPAPSPRPAHGLAPAGVGAPDDLPD